MFLKMILMVLYDKLTKKKLYCNNRLISRQVAPTAELINALTGDC